MKRLGLDIGSTTVKCVVADEAQNILFSRYERHLSRIQEASAALLGEAAACFPGEEMLFAMSGSAGMGMAADLALPFEDGLAGDAAVGNAGGILRTAGGVQRVAADAGDGDNVPVTLKARVHRPEHVVRVVNVDVLVHQNDMLELRER